MNNNKVVDSLIKFEKAISDYCYEILCVCDRLGISEIEIDPCLVSLSLPGINLIDLLKSREKIKIKIEPENYNYDPASCLVLYVPGIDRGVQFSRIKPDILFLDRLSGIIGEKVFKEETDPYIKFSDFDRKKLYFSGKDIVITDPCYIIKEEDRNIDFGDFPDIEDYKLPLSDENFRKHTINLHQVIEHYRGYQRYQKECEDYQNRINPPTKTNEELGIINYIKNSTIYGDWSCHVFEEGTHKSLGEFCADSGMVGVFDLSEILIHNPEFENWAKEHPWCVTIIPNFTGEVWMEIEEERWISETTGKEETDYSIHVIGKGSVNFKSTQTGF